MVIAGLIGNSLNILIFTNLKIFRGNQCAFYLIMESIADIMMLLIYFIPQIYQLIHGIEPGNLSLIWCKARTIVSQPCRLLIASIICFEALDQYLSTHHQFYFRQLSTIRLARYLIMITYSLWILQSIPYIIFYNIIPTYGCVITNVSMIHYYSYFYYIFLHGLFPILISSFFSLLAYRNVRHLIRLQNPIGRRKLDRQMTAMIFVRVITFVILLTPYTIVRLYSLLINIPSSNIHYYINQFILVIVVNLLLWTYSLNFYIFLVTSSRYRRQVKCFLMKRWCKSIHNEIHPLNIVSSMPQIKYDW